MKIVVAKSLLWLVLLNTTTTTAASSSSSAHRFLRGGEELSLQARQALSRAVLTAIRSPTNEIDPEALEKAVSMGIPRESVIKAATMAIERSGKNKAKPTSNKPIALDPRTVTMKDNTGSAGMNEEGKDGDSLKQQTELLQQDEKEQQQQSFGSSDSNTSSSSYGDAKDKESMSNQQETAYSSAKTSSGTTPGSDTNSNEDAKATPATSDYNNEAYKQGQKATIPVNSSAEQIQMSNQQETAYSSAKTSSGTTPGNDTNSNEDAKATTVTSDYDNDAYKQGQEAPTPVKSSAEQIQMAAGMTKTNKYGDQESGKSSYGGGSSYSSNELSTARGSSSSTMNREEPPMISSSNAESNQSMSGGQESSKSSYGGGSSYSSSELSTARGSSSSTMNREEPPMMSSSSEESNQAMSMSSSQEQNTYMTSQGSGTGGTSSTYVNAQPQNGQTSGQTVSSLPNTMSSSNNSAPKRRKFVEYQSSKWETLWLENVEKWGREQSICQVLFEGQQAYLHDYLEVLCTSRLESPYEKWCVIDDGDIQLWYNTENRSELETSWERPRSIPADVPVPSPQAVVPPPGRYDHILSKMTFIDEQTGEKYEEYIEPLVSHLRFPLSKCIHEANQQYVYHDTIFKGFILPPPPVIRGDRAIFFDAGSANWDKGPKYFLNTWLRHGIKFDDVFSFDENTKPDKFFVTIPSEYQNRIHYKQCTLASRPEENFPDHPFLPALIRESTTENDYVMFKLDIDRPAIEQGIIDFILRDDFPSSVIDEMFWEHHISQNYLMFEHWKATATPNTTFRNSYELFLNLRKKGIRAHSWT